MVNDSKIVSVIMPCFNAQRYIKDSVQSVLSQTYKHLELIVVDDGSTDSSLALLAKMREADGRVKVINQKNKGPGPARNKALSVAEGEYIAFLDADDYWSPYCLEKLQKALSSNLPSGWGLAYCGWQNIGLSKKRSQPFIPLDYASANLPEVFLGGCRWPIHAALFYKSCVDKISGFNEKWTSCMDYDLWLRMSPFLQVVLVPEVLAYYRHHDSGQITKNRALIAENHWKIQKDFLSNRPEIRKQIGKEKINCLLNGELLRKAYICYWERDLDAAHKIFRMVMKTGYGLTKDWKYMIPTLFPLFLYKRIIQLLNRD